jgi:outer membrane protein TolC
MALIASGMQKSQNEYFKNWVSHQAVLSSWKVQVTQELFNHGRERARRIRLIQRYLETRPRVSVKQRVEHSIISSILLQLDKMQDQKKLDLQMAQNDLEFWIGKKVDASELTLVMPDPSQVVSNFELNTSGDLELIQARQKLKITSLDREISLKEKRPDLYVGGGYRVENVERKNHFTYGILGITIPLWDTGSDRAEASRVREQREKKNLEEAERQLTLKQKNQIDLVKTNFEQLKRFPKGFVESNERSIHDAEFGFKQGVLDVNTFLQAETQSHEVIDQVFMSWLIYLENLSALQLMRNETLVWETRK